MSKHISLALITSAILVTGLRGRAVAQTGASQAASTEDVQRAIPAARYAHDPVLRRIVPKKPASLVNRDGQPLEAPVSSGADSDAQKAEFIDFDAPGAGTSSRQGTEAVAINLEGKITGYYIDSTGEVHGFMRYPEGEIATFDAPGSYGYTAPAAINPEGEITGTYTDVDNVYHGFLRNWEGGFVSFDIPRAGTNPYDGTFPTAINIEGAITGGYCNDVACDGFSRSAQGAITTFDPSNSPYVFPAGIDDFWAITGSYSDANNVSHGFLRGWRGDVLTFDPPSSEGTLPSAINPQGAIAGDYIAPENNPFGYLIRGFLRNLDGSFVSFDAATYSPCCIFSYPTAINVEGAITGYDNDGFNVYHGFVRAHNGSITTFDVPNAGTGDFHGTLAYGINLEGTITGSYIDANNTYHGFVRVRR